MAMSVPKNTNCERRDLFSFCFLTADDLVNVYIHFKKLGFLDRSYFRSSIPGPGAVLRAKFAPGYWRDVGMGASIIPNFGRLATLPISRSCHFCYFH